MKDRTIALAACITVLSYCCKKSNPIPAYFISIIYAVAITLAAPAYFTCSMVFEAPIVPYLMPIESITVKYWSGGISTKLNSSVSASDSFDTGTQAIFLA